MTQMLALLNLIAHDLGVACQIFVGRLPPELMWDDATFSKVWSLRPEERPWIIIHGGPVQAPRWMRAFGMDYHFSGRDSEADSVPPVLEPLLAWAKEAIDQRLNGILVNSYEGPGHYIGPHHDSTKNMVKGAPIVTVSFGETRIFRLTLEGKENGKKVIQDTKDFPAPHGTVFVMPYETNLIWKHGVPKSTRHTGRRISVTFRAFEESLPVAASKVG